MYRSLISGSNLNVTLPPNLVTHLELPEHKDVKIDYSYPKRTTEKVTPRPKRDHPLNIGSIRLPARINNPLIPYTSNVKNFILSKDKQSGQNIHDHHRSELIAIQNTMEKSVAIQDIAQKPISFEINHLKQMSRCRYSSRTELINMSALSFARRATKHDMGITAMDNIPFSPSQIARSPYMSLLISIHRLRSFLARLNKTSTNKFDVQIVDNKEASLILYDNFTYIYQAKCKEYRFTLIAGGGHFRLYHSNLDLWFAGTIVYLDYMFTTADILNNLEIIRNCNEYNWAEDFINLMIDIATYDVSHNDLVNFMKNLEGFLLNLSDYDESVAMNWRPLMDVTVDLYYLDKTISDIDYDYKLIPALIHNPELMYPKKSVLMNIIFLTRNMERIQIQELSSLHKFIFYAEVDADAGIEKFLKRVHTKRPYDERAVKNITRLAKSLFLKRYRAKHDTIPSVEGPLEKTKLLELYGNKNDMNTLDMLPLSWWDDITIFNCMDNTLTEDALEFAKDKGALKDEIYFGPGDSRKELLQVIEKTDYKLGDFFSQGPFVPKHPSVKNTNHNRKPIITKHPVRLIEKEREQKIEARLFANGELSNKHSLSLITTQMKKVLSYFDEQLMTPTDKNRKEILHLAAQNVMQPNIYSLLLDIEGHNQSMQAGNTSELAEFCGNLFGFRGWGTLPDYFSTIDVYHYNEFDDKVMVSQGQLGGIEGWLNPLWTLHTTLMMKLLRIMTDINIDTIMVYSDDVNALIEIRQATEASVQAVFNKIINHCFKFGMIVKFSQTNLSKHRVTMLRQHYADGRRADSSLKKLISTSGANNPMLMSEELEVSGICSSISSSLELSNHSETCTYLKNYKIGLLLSRLPHIILSHPQTQGMLSLDNLPKKLVNLLYYVKDDKSNMLNQNYKDTFNATKNDIANYLGLNKSNLNNEYLQKALMELYGQSIAINKFIDSPEKLLYLQIYDEFLQDLLFFWTYLPASIGGLGGILQINLMLSGHSSGFAKSIHYLHQWILNHASNKKFFLMYMETALSIDTEKEINMKEERILTSSWPNDMTITTATTSVSQSIKSMVKYRTRNLEVKKLFKLQEEIPNLQSDFIEIFRKNFHPRVIQFYYENTSVHFIDLLLNKVETSSGLLKFIRSLAKLRNSLVHRTMDNIRIGSGRDRTEYGIIDEKTDTVMYLILRRSMMFTKIKFIEVDEILYDNRVEETQGYNCMLTVRRCSPMHYQDGLQVYDTPHVGNEIRYKGELLDDDRMIGNKEEYLAAKLVAVTKWFLTKLPSIVINHPERTPYDCIAACNLSLSTLTGQKFFELINYSPNEVGGEILHRIPNLRFSTSTYIRSEMNDSLNFTVDINQRIINDMMLVDSNINFDYLRLRLLLASVVKSKYKSLSRLVIRYNLSTLSGIKDVQFVEPKITMHKVINKYTIYGSMREHTFSKLRFRYLSTHYLNSENLNDLTLIPTTLESNSQALLGDDLINDMIYAYSRNLDKEYMTILPTRVDLELWRPLINKIVTLEPMVGGLSDEELIDYIRNKLILSLTDRRRLTVIAKNDKVKLSLQNRCIDALKEFRPLDKEYDEITQRYSKLISVQRTNINMNRRLAKYQNTLNSFNDHRRRLALALICEYILLFHFKTKEDNVSIILDVEKSVHELLESGISTAGYILIFPEIQIQIMIVGHEYIMSLLSTDRDIIKSYLREIAEENTLADIIVPGRLPNLKPTTTITGLEFIPDSAKEVIYEFEPISYTAMSTFNEISPLCDFAHKCSTSGSHPSTFFSITGSDSFTAQYGLYCTLKDKLGLDASTRICDLTGGRGDFQFVCRELGLICDTYSISDTFTQIFSHPKVDFSKEYDIKNNESLKFITDYDVIHIDVSFTGSQRLNILDVILLMESHNLTYSIRINSVSLLGYISSVLESIPLYDHFISFPTNSTMKPYQIYLIGTPMGEYNEIEETSMKKTVAFRSLALSYSKLLSIKNYPLRLLQDEPNSASIYIQSSPDISELIMQICRRAEVKEKLYYLKRYIAELDDKEEIYWHEDSIPKSDMKIVRQLTKNANFTDLSCYEENNENDIGGVSKNSRPFHIIHLKNLRDDNEMKMYQRYDYCDEEFLDYMRVHHPLNSERSKCNVVLGMKQFCRAEMLSGRRAVEDSIGTLTRYRGPEDTLHQKELQNALKLLIISVSKGDYTYGILHCHNLIAMNQNNRQSVIRTIRCYRLLSYYYDFCRQLFFSGKITLASVESMQNDLEVREIQKVRYRKQEERKIEDFFDGTNIENLIDSSLDELFTNLENWTMSKKDIVTNEEGVIDLDLDTGQLNMSFNLNIQEQIDRMVIKLGLTEPNKYGFIDLGDDGPIHEWDED